MANEPLEQNENQKTLSEQLTEDFYKWEQRGRGWLLWDFPVRLEPPFIPFISSVFTREPIVDDGRKPSLLTSFAEKVKNKFASSEEQEKSKDYFFSQGPEFLTESAPLTSVTVSVPEGQKIDFDYTEQFLLNLRYCKFPVSFEIVGCFEEISFQVICREPDFSTVIQQLKAYFPDAALYENQQPKCRLDRNNPSVIVDFGLSQEFMRPLKAFRGFEPDPLTGIVGSMENLAEGEMAMFQILFEPVRNPWHENILKSLTDCEGGNFFTDSPEMIKLAQEKINKPLLAAVIRVAGSSQSEARAWEITKGLAAGLQQVSNPPSNELIPLDTDEAYTHDLHFDDLYYRQSHRTGMLLNTAELLSLVHLPSVSVKTAKLKREIKRTKQAPSIVSGHKLVLGKNVHQGKEIEVTLSPIQRRRHTYIIGTTGRGKSTLFLNMIRQDIQQGNGIAVLDPHGDLIEHIMPYVPEERFDDVILLDAADSNYPVGLNVLSAHSEQEKTLLSSDLVGVFRRLSTSWGDQMNSVFANAILAFLESEKGGTLIDLQHFLVDNSFRRDFLKTVTDQQVIYYWKKQFPMLRPNACSPILTRLNEFLRRKSIRNMVIQKEGLDFQKIMDTKKIFLANLSQGMVSKGVSYLLGALLVTKFHQAAMARQAQPEEKRKDFYLYVDEFQNFATQSMTEILSEARKYRLGLIVTHQELKQLWSQNPELASSVRSNPGTRICFGLGDFDAKKLEEGFSYFEAKDLTNLDVGEAIVRVDKSDYDFNIETYLPENVPHQLGLERKEKIIELSRKKYAKSRKELEQLLDWQEEALKEKAPAVETPTIRAKKPAPKEKAAKPKSELSLQEQGFLKFIDSHSGKFVTKIYKALKLSGYKGDKLKNSLIEKGLVVQQETRKGKRGRLAKELVLTEKGQALAQKLTTRGKGGDVHQQLQESIAEQAKVFGWKADIEKKIPRSLESVDVELKKDDIKVAVEIASTTKPKHEKENIKKCLQAGYDYILAVSSDDKLLAEIKRLVKQTFNSKEKERIYFYSPESIKHFFHTTGGSIVSEKPIVSGQIKKQKELLNVKEAAAYLGVAPSTLYMWGNQRKIPYIKVGGNNRYRVKDLEKWLEKRLQKEESYDILDD